MWRRVILTLLGFVIAALAVWFIYWNSPLRLPTVRSSVSTSSTIYPDVCAEFLNALESPSASDRCYAVGALVNPEHYGFEPQVRIGIWALEMDEDAEVRVAAAQALHGASYGADRGKFNQIILALSRAMAKDKVINNREVYAYYLKDTLFVRARKEALDRALILKCVPYWSAAAKDRASKDVSDTAQQLLKRYKATLNPKDNK